MFYGSFFRISSFRKPAAFTIDRSPHAGHQTSDIDWPLPPVVAPVTIPSRNQFDSKDTIHGQALCVPVDWAGARVVSGRLLLSRWIRQRIPRLPAVRSWLCASDFTVWTWRLLPLVLSPHRSGRLLSGGDDAIGLCRWWSHHDRFAHDGERGLLPRHRNPQSAPDVLSADTRSEVCGRDLSAGVIMRTDRRKLIRAAPSRSWRAAGAGRDETGRRTCGFDQTLMQTGRVLRGTRPVARAVPRSLRVEPLYCVCDGGGATFRFRSGRSLVAVSRLLCR